MSHFKKKPFTFTELYKLYDRVEKIDSHTVRFHMKKPYAVFLQDAIWLHFYTEKYLKKYGWNGKPVCPNLAAPGPYGAGPFILKEGYIEGDRATDKAELVANPYYWDPRYPKVERVTVFTSLKTEEAIDMALNKEGLLDISPIPFSQGVNTVLSKYSKMFTSPSTNNYAIHLNMISGNKALLNAKIRQVINQSIDREMLLNLSMIGEGTVGPSLVSPNFAEVAAAIKANASYFDNAPKYDAKKTDELKKIVQEYQKSIGKDPSEPLKLTFLTQEQFLFVIRDVKFFLQQVGIELDLKVVKAEKLVFAELLNTSSFKNKNPWDMLIWGNFDWFRHPWSSFLVYRVGDNWSTINKDAKLSRYIEELFRTDPQGSKYVPLVGNIMKQVHKNNYMLFLPNPNAVFAVNKEVVYKPRSSAFYPLWEMEVTNLHWSVRGKKEYPEELRVPTEVQRFNVSQKEHRSESNGR